MKKNNIICLLLSLLFLLALIIDDNYSLSYKENSEFLSYDISNIPKYDGKHRYVFINDNIPFFKEDEMNALSFERYGELDYLDRCTTAFANISTDTMPTEERKSIGQIKPTGWHTVKYDIVDKKYLYNRCHLIAFQLTGENDNEKNLITCTRQMNSETMLEFENIVANYIRKTKNHVLYRVTPIFENDNLLATGVLMEAKSIEDGGEGVSFNVFVYNIQDGIEIDYRTGDSRLKD